MNKTQTVVNMGMSRTNRNMVELSISDEHSSDLIARIEMSLQDFALLVTGLHGVKSKAEVFEQAHIAKKRETLSVDSGIGTYEYSSNLMPQLIEKHFKENYAEDGWFLQSDGAGTQQRNKTHFYVIKRYVDVENPLEVERFY